MKKLFTSIRHQILLLRGLVPKRAPGRAYLCVGGPYHGQHLRLDSPSTLTFSVAGHVGRYIRHRRHLNQLVWEKAE